MVLRLISGDHSTSFSTWSERYHFTIPAITVTCLVRYEHRRSPEAPAADIALQVIGMEAQEAAVADNGDVAGGNAPTQCLQGVAEHGGGLLNGEQAIGKMGRSQVSFLFLVRLRPTSASRTAIRAGGEARSR